MIGKPIVFEGRPSTRYLPVATAEVVSAAPPPPVAGFTWYDGAYATRPVAGSATNDAFSGTDDFVLERDDGAAWQPWGPLFPMAEPPTDGWSWVNQGGATIDESLGALMLWCPATAVYSWRCRVRSMPQPPWMLTLAMASTGIVIEGHGSALVLRDSNSGRIITHGPLFKGGGDYRINRILRWTNATTFSAAAVDWRLASPDPIWLRVVDDNVNFTYYWSLNGQDWIQLLQEGRTAFLAAPDQIGFAGEAEANLPNATTILSWEES